MCASFRGLETKFRRADTVITINNNTTPSSEAELPIIWFTDYSVQHSLLNRTLKPAAQSSTQTSINIHDLSRSALFHEDHIIDSALLIFAVKFKWMKAMSTQNLIITGTPSFRFFFLNLSTIHLAQECHVKSKFPQIQPKPHTFESTSNEATLDSHNQDHIAIESHGFKLH